MALTIGEAQDVQWVLKLLTGGEVDHSTVVSAAMRLANRSRKVLGAGLNSDDVVGLIADNDFEYGLPRRGATS